MTEGQAAERIAALEREVAELRERLDRAPPAIGGTMRFTLCCPACRGRTILNVRGIVEPQAHSRHLLALQNHFSDWTGAVNGAGGVLTAFVCRQCGYVEWYAGELDKIVIDGKAVVELDGTAPPETPHDPYR